VGKNEENSATSSRKDGGHANNSLRLLNRGEGGTPDSKRRKEDRVRGGRSNSAFGGNWGSAATFRSNPRVRDANRHAGLRHYIKNGRADVGTEKSRSAS